MFLFTADWHLKLGRLHEYRFGIFDVLTEIADEYGCRHLIMLGDLTDDKDRHPGLLIDRMVEGFAKLSDKFESVRMIHGNHDYSTEISYPMKLLDMVYKNVHYYYETSSLKIDGYGFLMIPHTYDFRKVLENLDISGHDFVCIHQPLIGSITNTVTLNNGDDPALLDPASGYVVAGDIHTPQKVGRVVYTGSPYHIKFGDNHRPRVLLYEDHDLKSVEIGSKFPSKVIIHTDESLRLNEDLREGDFVKFHVYMQSASKNILGNIRDRLSKICSKHSLIFSGVEFSFSRSGSTRIDQNYTSSIDKVFSDYCARNVSDKEVVRYGKEIIEAYKSNYEEFQSIQ